MQPIAQQLPSSYRDPSGFMFEHQGILYRQVNAIFKEHFDHFTGSGCYEHFIQNGWLVAHIEEGDLIFKNTTTYKTLRPEVIPFISYPYEWSFDMLRDAALHTLKLLKEGLSYEVMLKDASPYNIQWRNGKPIFIDTLSFEKYQPVHWIAYRQFCECFLAPLLLMHYTGQPLQSLLLFYPDGIPLSVAAGMLPARSHFSVAVNLHLHLHAALSKKPSKENRQTPAFPRKKLEQLVTSLESLLLSLSWKTKTSTWENYYAEALQRNDYVHTKKQIVTNWIQELPHVSTAVDLGANEGEFSLLAATNGMHTLATDTDHASINKLYLKIKKEGISNVLPLIIDVTHPSPAIGFNNQEREAFVTRARSELGLVLALLHHLCIGKNLPFEKVAQFLGQLFTYLIIEFIPKEDVKVQLMLNHKKDIYAWYTRENFLKVFSSRFRILKEKELGSSKRILYLMQPYD